MADMGGVVFFASNQPADVIPREDLPADARFGQVRRVRWQGRQYNAKILYIGAMQLCEEKVSQVSCGGFLCEGDLDCPYVSNSRVEALRNLRSGNMNHFALDIEREVFDKESEDLQLHIEKNIATADRVYFIRKCVFKYCRLPEESRQAAWRAVKAALNSRARRLKRKLIHGVGNGTPSRCTRIRPCSLFGSSERNTEQNGDTSCQRNIESSDAVDSSTGLEIESY
ncbi:hypothetical protein Aduo_018418 [Ancylostoma duodenale]